MQWFNKVFHNERNGKDTIIDFNDLDDDVKVIIACCADGLLQGDLISYSYSDSMDIEVLRSLNSYYCYLNGLCFCDVPLKVISDFFFQTYEEKGSFDEIAGTDEEHGTEEDQDTTQDITSREEDNGTTEQIGSTAESGGNSESVNHDNEHFLKLPKPCLFILLRCINFYRSDLYRDIRLSALLNESDQDEISDLNYLEIAEKCIYSTLDLYESRSFNSDIDEYPF